MDLAPGHILDRFTVETVLGKGGMATVYRLRHNALDSLCALKVLQAEGSAHRERLMQEGRAQAKLRHPNIVAVTDVIDVGGAPGLLMEYVDGSPLDRWLQRGRPSLAEAEHIFAGILAGVARAHRDGFVHRDLKPANVLLDHVDGRLVPKVADFGLVRAMDDGDADRAYRTRAGMAMGTPSYMAPEQIRDASTVDHRADVFSLGCILYELVTGHRAFDGADMMETFTAITTGRYTPPRAHVADLPERLVRAIEGCLEPDRERRLQDCAALSRVIDAGQAPTVGAVAPRAASTPLVSRPTFAPSQATFDPSPNSIAPPPTSFDPSPPGPAPSQPTIDPAPALAPSSSRVGPRPVLMGLVATISIAAVAFLVQRSPPEPAPVAAPAPAAPAAEVADPPQSGVDAAMPPTVPPPVPPKTAAAPTARGNSGEDLGRRVLSVPRPAAAAITVVAEAAEPATSPPSAAIGAAVPPPSTGSFRVTGDAHSVYVKSASGSFRAGEPVPPGEYAVFALFEGATFAGAGTVVIVAGAEVTLRCTTAFTTCTAR